QANRKRDEGASHPDRNEQFEHIYQKVQGFLATRQPVISVDAKKKENLGNFKNAGTEYHRAGKAPQVRVYDFLDKGRGKAIPYGVYDLAKDQGWVSVGISHDTAEFAVATIRAWWRQLGKPLYKQATDLYITADGGGSNGSRVRLWKTELQRLANALHLTIHVSHFPPGTSKWNKIEHRMFSFISKNWRGPPPLRRLDLRKPHREHENENGPDDHGSPRPQTLWKRSPRQRSRIASRESPARSLPWGMELFHPTANPSKHRSY